ncbi:MAG: hypothetical protein ACRDIE_00195, partial [Chloroflexota bacterium]
MAIALGMRLTGALRGVPISDTAAFARQAGLDALDLPADFSAGADACRAGGLRIGTVDGVGAGELISADDAVRERAVTAIRDQIGALARSNIRVIFLCLVPRDNGQTIARSLALFMDSFPTVAQACEASGVRIA